MHAHGDAWLTLTHGEKLWLVFPPGGLPPPAGSANVSAELAGRLALQNAATVLKMVAHRVGFYGIHRATTKWVWRLSLGSKAVRPKRCQSRSAFP